MVLERLRSVPVGDAGQSIFAMEGSELMPQRIEQASGATAVWGSAIAIAGQLLGWISENATLCGLLIAFGGLLLQASTARYNRKIRSAEEARKKAEELRSIEEHELRMRLLMAEYAEQQSKV